MGLNNLFVEEAQIVMAIVPVDSQTAANNGDWVSLKNFERCTLLLIKAAGTAGDDPVFTVRQAQDVSGTGAKALNFTRIDAKVGTQTGIGAFTTVTQAAGNTYTDTVSAEAQAIMAVEFKAEDLDVNNGFDCIQLQIPDTGSAGAQLITGLYILRGGKFNPALSTSAIVD